MRRREWVLGAVTIAATLLMLAPGAPGAAASGGETYLRQDFTTETDSEDMYGPLLSEVPAKCESQEKSPDEKCHWTRTQGADVAGHESENPEFAPANDVQTDEELSPPYGDPEYDKVLAPDNYWHIQKNPQTIEILPLIRNELIELGTGESASLPATLAEDKEPSGVATRYAWFGEGDEKGEPHEAATGTYCGLEPKIKENNAGEGHHHDGCTSQGTPEGELVSPPFSLEDASAAYLHFKTWWEIEAESPAARDLMGVDYSIDGGKDWNVAALLNPAENQLGSTSASSDYQPYSNMGRQRAPEWSEDVVDLQAALHSPEVEVRFRFDAREDLYNGYRGWAVDNVEVNSSAPSVPAITACSLGSSGTPVLEGSGFVLGSKVEDDSYGQASTLAQSSTRIELKHDFFLGLQTLQVFGPAGTASSNRVTVNVTPTSCTLLGASSETTTTTTTTTTTSAGTGTTSYPSTPPTQRGHANVDYRTGEIEGEFEFPEPGRAEWTATVPQGASLARAAGAGMASLADPLAALERRVAGHATTTTTAKAKRCAKGYVRKAGRCVDDAPVAYGHSSRTLTKKGRYRLTIRPSAKALSALRKGRRLSVRLTLTFTPAHTSLHLAKATTVSVYLRRGKAGT